MSRTRRFATHLGAALALTLLATPLAAQAVYLGTGSGGGGAGSHYGHAVAQLHDVDADGQREFLVGAPGHDGNGTDSGAVIVVDAVHGTLVHQLYGAAGDELGWAVANLGDVSGDGVDDFAAGRPGRDFLSADTGGVVVYSGASGGILWSKTWSQTGARAGSVLAAVGDVNADGRGDLLVGAPGFHGPNVIGDANWGRAVLYSGLDGATLATFTGSSKNDRLGAALAGLPDLDGDGVQEFAIGVPGKEIGSPLSIVDAGSCLVYSGSSKTLLFSVDGSSGDEACGASIAALGDSDLDGLMEFVVGRPGWSSTRGRVSVHEGGSGTLIQMLNGPALTAADAYGTALSAAGDVNKDGHVDLIVAAPATGSAEGGYTHVISGKTWTQYGERFHASDVFGSAFDWGFGTTLAAGLDTSDDGWPDAVFGMPLSDIGGTDKGFVWGLRFTVYQPDYSPDDFFQTGSSYLSMYGTELSTGGLADLRITGAPAFSPVYLLASLTGSPTPFKGGVLVPGVGGALIRTLFSNAKGRITITNIAGGLGDFDVHVQAVMPHASGPLGWWLTNAITAEWLP